jgi:hypothetical protein
VLVGIIADTHTPLGDAKYMYSKQVSFLKSTVNRKKPTPELINLQDPALKFRNNALTSLFLFTENYMNNFNTLS